MAIGVTREGTFTDDDVLAVLSEAPPRFDYGEFLAKLGVKQLHSPPPDADDIPPEQWQEALNMRPLTPAEQAARERYFERKVTQALRSLKR